jgi:glycosyltransferase involved in cell wall biosynthesis
MKVSVLIPTYNRSYIIRDALESALAQTFRDFEIVVVDDGSSDKTEEIVASLGSDRIRYIRHETNRGCSAACNTAIGAAAGDLLAFLDSDDLWKPEYLDRQVRFLDAHPGIDIVFSDMELQEKSGTYPSLMGLMKCFPRMLQGKPGQEEYVFRGREMYVCLLEEVPIKPTATVTRRELFQIGGGFNETWPSGTDWDLFLRFSKIADFGYIHVPLVIQRRTPDATHQKFREQDKLFLLSTFLQEKAKLTEDPEALEAVNRGIASHCMILAGLYLDAGLRRKSFSVYVQGFKETREPLMLLRAASTSLPANFRSSLRRVFRGRLGH